MTFKKLSEQVHQLTNPQRSDAFVKLFRAAVRVGTFDAIALPERFQLPKQFRRHDSEGRYQKNARDMLFAPTPAFEAWFQETDRTLTLVRTGSQVKPSVTAIEAGLLDFKVLVADTRRSLQASYDKGQALGRSRSKGRKGSR